MNPEKVINSFRVFVPTDDQINENENNEEDQNIKYKEIDWEPTPNAYWVSSNSTIGTQLSVPEISNATNHKFFIGSKLFTRDDLPVGSIIEIDPGYQYRPDGWIDINVPGAKRPGNVTKNKVVVDEDWWGDYQYRGFNIAIEGAKQDITGIWQEVATHFRIKVPTDEDDDDDNDNEVDNGKDTDDEKVPGTGNGEPFKLLAIGNSFSEDALTYLQLMAQRDGLDIDVGILYIGGSELAKHWDNALNDKAAYTYIEYKNGFKNSIKNSQISTVLEKEDWDYVSLQQASHFSGIFSTYEPYLKNLEAYVKERVLNTEILIHETWAYEDSSTHHGFRRFNQDTTIMYNKVSEAYRLAAESLGNVKIIPSGLAMQNARKHELFDPSMGGKSLFRDGYHANYTHGRLLLASVWYETLTDNDVTNNNFIPGGVTQEEAKVLKEEAKKAVAQYNPNISKLDLQNDLGGFLWYEGEKYYDTPNSNEPVADLKPNDKITISVDDDELFGNGLYDIGILAAGPRTKYEIELNGVLTGVIEREANSLKMNNVTMTFSNITDIHLKTGDVISIVASDDSNAGWVDALVLRNKSLDDPLDFSILEELYNEHKNKKQNNYTDSTWNEFSEILNAVEEFLNNKKAIHNQEDIDVMYKRLLKALNGLEEEAEEEIEAEEKVETETDDETQEIEPEIDEKDTVIIDEDEDIINEDQMLPNTSTNIYNILLVGLIFVLIGTACLKYYRKIFSQ